MEGPPNDFDSVQWRRDDDQADTSSPPAKLKSNGKRRQSVPHPHLPDHNADAVDTAGIGAEGFLECTVEQPQKEHDGTKDAFISYLVTTESDFKTFTKPVVTVRRRFTDFVYLYKTLFRYYAHVAVPPLPEKHKMEYVRGDRFGTDFTQRRAHSLQRFIKRIALHPVLRRNTTFLSFLETPDWNSVMTGRPGRGSSFSDAGVGASLGAVGSANSSTSAFESFQDWSMNLFTKPHKPDKRFIEVREKADKLDGDLGHVEKVVARVARREGDLEADYADLATQFRKLVNLEAGVADELTSFAASVETTSQGMKALKEATDQDYLGSLREMSSYVTAVKALLKVREQKQLDFEALTEYLTKSANDRDILASQHGPPSLSSGAGSFIRGKIEDVRGVDHEQSRRDRLRRTEMQIERLTREVEESKTMSEAFDDQVMLEVAEFERIKAYEFRDTLGALAEAELQFYKGTIMLEARLEQANLLKKVVDAIKDLVQDCNFDCNDSGIALQAMDNSHVALVSMLLSASAFSPFRCDRNIALGINLTSLTKVLRCAQNDDILTLKAEDAPDVVNLVFESSESDRLSEYDIKLMDIDQEHLGIPETQYAATISMPSAEFQRICRDLMALSESVAIECTKEGVKFACNGDIGSGSVTLRSNVNVDAPEKNIEINLSEPVALTFSLKYLVNFCKAAGLSTQVKLCLSNEVPLLVEYALGGGVNSYLRFYLAPKIGDEE